MCTATTVHTMDKALKTGSDIIPYNCSHTHTHTTHAHTTHTHGTVYTCHYLMLRNVHHYEQASIGVDIHVCAG